MTAVLIARAVRVAGEERRGLRGLDLEVQAGEAVAITALGTTDLALVMETLSGMVPPAEGEIVWGGISSRLLEGPGAKGGTLAYRSLRELRTRVGFLSPSASLIQNLTLWDNIALPLRYHRVPRAAEVAAKVESLIETLGLGEVARRRPAGLPPGTQRRAELARTLVLDPPLLLLDSPMTLIDDDSEEILLSTLKAWRDERRLAIVAASYEPVLLLPLVSRVVVLGSGKVLGSLEGPELEDPAVVRDRGLLARRLQKREPQPCEPPSAE